MNCSKILKTLLIVVILITLTGSAEAQKPDQLTGMNLDTRELTLDPGQSFTFKPEFTTRPVSGYTPIEMKIFSSDERVVRPGKELNSIEAAGGGEATVYLYSADYAFSAACNVTVSGESVSIASKGEIWMGPDAKELGKISDPALKVFFGMLGRPEMADSAANLANSQKFKTLIRVASGEAENLAQTMRELGMAPVYAFDLINTVSAAGTPDQYLVLLQNDSVLRIDEDEIQETEDMLEGQAETISHFSTAHSLGLDGSGTAIAFLDSGIFASHEQFTGKKDSSVLYQACFSSSDASKGDIAVCKNGKTEDRSTSEIGSQVHNISEFTHGTHVTAIAAGKDGIAPKSNIISVNVFTEFSETCQDKSGNVKTCYSGGTYTSDQIRGLQYILNLLDEDNKIAVSGKTVQLAAVNMSLGGGRYSNVCKDDRREPYILELLNRGVITPASSGNSGWNDSVTSPACAPSAFAVGALQDSGEPTVASYSNHSKLVDILAPGTRIHSAAGSSNQYQTLTGTSMAAPMVSGSAALVRQLLPNLNGQSVKTLLTEMSRQKATRNKVTKPVLDLSAIQSGAPYLANGPEFRVYGGDKLLRIDFSSVPFTTKCSLKVYETDENNDLAKGRLVKSYEGKNPKSVLVKGLNNDAIYLVEANCSVTLAKVNYAAPAVIAYGMPMVQGKGFAVERNSESSARLSWTEEEGSLLYAEYGLAADDKPHHTSGSQSCIAADLPSGKPVYISLYKVMQKAGHVFLSLPTGAQYVSVGNPKILNAVPGSGRIWLEFGEEKDLSSREIQVWTAEGSNSANLKLLSKQKTLNLDNKKNPTDAVITGLKNDTAYAVCYRNIVKVGKSTFYGDWSIVGPLVPNAGKFERISNITLTSGSRAAALTFSKDLSVDGYVFEFKPIVPNRNKITIEVKADKALGAYSFKDLPNGVVYKLRIGKYKADRNTKNYSEYYPYSGGNLTGAQEDSAWPGLIFIPLPEAEYDVTPKYDNKPLTISVTNTYSADGFTVVVVNGNPDGKSCIKSVPWSEGEKTELRLAAEDTARQILVMLYKDYNGKRYYGPANWNGDISNSEYLSEYGPKSVSEYDLFSEPKLASSPQIAGQLMISPAKNAGKATKITPMIFDEDTADRAEALESKDALGAAEEDPEIRLLDNTEEVPEAISVQEAIQASKDETEGTDEKPGPEIAGSEKESGKDEDPAALNPEAAETEENSEELPAGSETGSPAEPEKEKKDDKQGFSFFFIGK